MALSSAPCTTTLASKDSASSELGQLPECPLLDTAVEMQKEDTQPKEDAQPKENADESLAAPPSRLEALIEEQNSLMLRQLQLAEEKSQQAMGTIHHYTEPRNFLKALDPCVRGIFRDWQKEFCSKVRVYVVQSELSTKYESVKAKGELMKPFVDEARRPWEWTPFYRSVAKPIDGIDPSLPNGVPVGLADAHGNLRTSPDSGTKANTYDIDLAFAELRRRHASELQDFVIIHQKSCLEKVIEELSMPNQIEILQERLAGWVAQHSGFYHPQIKDQLQQQAKNFIEIVYRDEMPKAERKIKGDKAPSSSLVTVMRVTVFVSIILSATTVSHEILTRLFASLFALLCGMALLWEDLVMCGVRVLLGESIRRLRLLGALPERMRTQVNAAINVDVPSIFW